MAYGLKACSCHPLRDSIQLTLDVSSSSSTTKMVRQLLWMPEGLIGNEFDIKGSQAAIIAYKQDMSRELEGPIYITLIDLKKKCIGIVYAPAMIFG